MTYQNIFHKWRTGKTFLYKALLAIVRSKGEIALATTSCGVATSILPRGCTTHSRFKIPIHENNDSGCSVNKQSSTARLIKQVKLIIWDKATTAKKYAIECFEMLIKDIIDSDIILGGKVVAFGGDFRQTLPVVVKGYKEDYISTSLAKSYVWNYLEKLHLVENMCAHLHKLFSEVLLSLGNGTLPCFGDFRIVLSHHLTMPFIDDRSSLSALIRPHSFWSTLIAYT